MLLVYYDQSTQSSDNISSKEVSITIEDSKLYKVYILS